MKKNTLLFIFLIALLGLSCDDQEVLPNGPDSVIQNRVDQFKRDYQDVLMPEELAIASHDSTTLAMYTTPTGIYSHNILGDALEAKALVVEINGRRYEVMLEDDQVFEDLAPRLYDVDQDGEMEFICIRTHVDLGAGIAIYKQVVDSLTEWSFLPEIGTRFRWLNPVGVADFDLDGTLDLAWIETPHIGGVLKYATLRGGEMSAIATKGGYSNHGIGERNLCLSVLTSSNDSTVVHVPSQNRGMLKSLTVVNQAWVEMDAKDLTVDFSKPLTEQASFIHPMRINAICVE